MGKITLADRYNGSEIFCPLSQRDEFVMEKCDSQSNGSCSYFKSLARSSDGKMVLECGHPDIEACNPYAEVNL